MPHLPTISTLYCTLDILFALLILLTKQILSTGYLSNVKESQEAY